MQGRKNFALQLFYKVSLDELVPPDNYYRVLDRELDLHFLYRSTKSYYGKEGQQGLADYFNNHLLGDFSQSTNVNMTEMDREVERKN